MFVIFSWFIFDFNVIVEEKGKFDELVEDNGVKIFIDLKVLMYVIGIKMDFVDDKFRYVGLDVF